MTQDKGGDSASLPSAGRTESSLKHKKNIELWV